MAQFSEWARQSPRPARCTPTLRAIRTHSWEVPPRWHCGASPVAAFTNHTPALLHVVPSPGKSSIHSPVPDCMRQLVQLLHHTTAPAGSMIQAVGKGASLHIAGRALTARRHATRTASAANQPPNPPANCSSGEGTGYCRRGVLEDMDRSCHARPWVALAAYKKVRATAATLESASGAL